MDPRLLQAYEEELTYLRESAREFGEEYEGVAGRLGLKAPTNADPYVERLLEGVAFLGARVQLKLQDQFPEFTQHLLHAIQPHYLAPTPSICVVAFEPKEGDQAIEAGFQIPRLTELTTNSGDPAIASVIFRTGHDVTLWPLAIAEAEYLPTRAAVARYATVANVRAEAGLRIRFTGVGDVPLDKVAPPDLPIHLAGSEAIPGELYRQLAGECVAAIAGPAGGGAKGDTWKRVASPEPHGMGDDCALLPAQHRSFTGYRLLTEYFACPERFLYVRLRELAKAFAASGNACDVVFLFSRSARALAGAVSPANLSLFSTPAINLFEKQLGRVRMTPYEHEHLAMPDRARPLDFEVYRILEMTAYDRDNTTPRPVAPLYAFGALLYDWRDALFYQPRLRMRRLSTREQRLRRRADYVGSETWFSLTAPGDPERLRSVYEVAIRALVTNRELPELMRFGGSSGLSVSGAPVRSIRVLTEPTPPRPPLGLGDGAWRVIAHLTPNYATLTPEGSDDPSVLRDHLALYGRQDDPLMRRQIDGLTSIRSARVTRRLPGLDRMAFARGIHIHMTLDDASYENGRLYLFASVLEQFLAEFAAINSFVECVFETPKEGVFARWPPSMGRKPSI